MTVKHPSITSSEVRKVLKDPGHHVLRLLLRVEAQKGCFYGSCKTQNCASLTHALREGRTKHRETCEIVSGDVIPVVDYIFHIIYSNLQPLLSLHLLKPVINLF